MHGLGHILALRPEQEGHPLAPGCISHLRDALPQPPVGSALAVVHADGVLSVSCADWRSQQQHSPCACDQVSHEKAPSVDLVVALQKTHHPMGQGVGQWPTVRVCRWRIVRKDGGAVARLLETTF